MTDRTYCREHCKGFRETGDLATRIKMERSIKILLNLMKLLEKEE